MTALAYMQKLVRAQLLVYARNKLPYWAIIPLGGFLAIAKINNGKGIIPVDSILPWLVLFIFMINEQLIVCPFFTADDELRKLWLFPLNMARVVTAKYIASTLILTGYVAVSFLVALLIFPIPFINAVNAFLSFVCTLLPLYMLGNLPLWSLNIHREASFAVSTMFTIAIGLCSLPLVLTRPLPMHGVVWGLWIIIVCFVWQRLVLPKSAKWIIDKKYRRDEV